MFAHFEIYYFLQQLCFVLPINCNQYLFVFIYTTKDFYCPYFLSHSPEFIALLREECQDLWGIFM